MKKIILISTISTMVISLSINWDFLIENENNLSNLQLQNIEAMAEDEDISARIDCYGTGNKHCPIDNQSKYKEIKIIS